MPASTMLKYRAFLSYSHADTRWAKWLHRQLESFQFDKDLVGRETALGAIPKTLQPIFRDREEFTGGQELTEATVAAIDQSAALIVLCSPAAVESKYVNEEVRVFKLRHPDRPVVPVIVDGKSPENFPLALRFQLAYDGTVSDQPVTILAPDVRENGDGKHLALAKVIAGITGLATDEIFRRAERGRRRKSRNWIVGLSTVTVALTALTVWAEINRRHAIEQRDKSELTIALLNENKEKSVFISTQAIFAVDQLVIEIAHELGSTQGVPPSVVRSVLKRALDMQDQLSKLNLTSVDLKRLHASTLMAAGKILTQLNDTNAAIDALNKAHEIWTDLVYLRPYDSEWQSELAGSLDLLADAKLMAGDLPAAIANCSKSLSILRKLLNNGKDTVAERHIAFTLARVGALRTQMGDLTEAQAAFNEAKIIFCKRVKNKDDSEARNDLAMVLRLINSHVETTETCP